MKYLSTRAISGELGWPDPLSFSIKDTQSHWDSGPLIGSGKLSLNVHGIIKPSIWNPSSVAELTEVKKGHGCLEGLQPLSVQGDEEERPSSGLALLFSICVLGVGFVSSAGRAPALGSTGTPGEREASRT